VHRRDLQQRCQADAAGGIGEGDILWITRHARRAKLKVVWIGKSSSELEGKIGVETLEPEKFIWDDELRTKLV